MLSFEELGQFCSCSIVPYQVRVFSVAIQGFQQLSGEKILEAANVYGPAETERSPFPIPVSAPDPQLVLQHYTRCAQGKLRNVNTSAPLQDIACFQPIKCDLLYVLQARMLRQSLAKFPKYI